MADRLKGITLEIGGDTTKLSKALSGVNSDIIKTKSSLKDVERLLKLDPTNVELLRLKQKLLTDEIGSTKEKLDKLKDAQQTMDASGVDKNTDQYMALQREIIATEQELRNLEDGFRDFGSVGVQQISAVGDKLTSIGDKITDVGNKVSVLSGAVTAVGVGSAKYSMDFEDAMAKVNTIADTSRIPLEELEAEIIKLSDVSGTSAVDIANNVYDAISAGVDTTEAVNFVAQATTLARAGFTDTGSALDLLTTIMNAYGFEASEVNRVCDTLITTQNLGKTTVAELSSYMGKVIPTAKAQCVTLEDLCSTYAVLTANGISTAETTTYLNAMFNELGKDGTAAQKALSEGHAVMIGGEKRMNEVMKEEGATLFTVIDCLREMAAIRDTGVSNLFGSAEGGKAAAVLADNSEKLMDFYDQMIVSTGATETAYGKLETTSFQVQKSINELKNVAIQLGDSLMQTLGPIIDEIAEKIRQFSEWFSELSDGQKETIVKIGLVVAAAGPLLIIIGQILSGIGSVCHAISSTGPAISFFSEKVLPGLSSAISGAFSFITGTLLPGLSSAFSSVFAFIAANPIVLLIAAIVALVALIATKGDEIQAILQKVDDFLQGVFTNDWTEVFGPVLGGILNTFFANVKNIWDSFKEMLDGVIDIIRGVFTDDWERVWNGVQEIFAGIFDGMLAIAEAPLNGIIGFLNMIIDGANWCIEKLNQIPGVNIDTFGDIPFFANGGTLYRGSAVVGDGGPEILTVSGGKATVTPLTGPGATGRPAAAASAEAIRTFVEVNFGGSLSQLAAVLQPAIVAETQRLGGSFTR